MEYITGVTRFDIKGPTAVSLGKFDGLHRGHKKLLGHLFAAKERGQKSVVITFDVPPGVRLSGAEQKVLLTNAERRDMLAGMGADVLIECPFVPEISRMEPERFVGEVLCGQLHAAYMAVGTDFRFGYGRKGDPALLLRLAPALGYEIDVVEKERHGDRDVSSSYVREALEKGDMELVSALLGYSYTVGGTVVHGRHMGREVLGIPTANLIPEKEKLLPPNGVYVSEAFVRGKWRPGITNIGRKPTVGGAARRGAETHIFGFEGDIYGSDIRVRLHTFVRPEKKFDSLESLKRQMQADIRFGLAKSGKIY